VPRSFLPEDFYHPTQTCLSLPLTIFLLDGEPRAIVIDWARFLVMTVRLPLSASIFALDSKTTV
jgi:hypothetical protein